ncbi:anillin isoform X2 [Tribolium madens]|uniref:anillin isoform X2 n=1 Tax=Tribolium madens TaxID=41895 RepID=UPI001CF73975|nr:anillin isoform X2 [Tribolium madens]
MDSFTENLLTRARERQKLLEDYNSDLKKTPPRNGKVTTLSQPNLNANSPNKLENNSKSEGNLTRTHISSDFTSHKSLNIQNDSFNMEIKVSSADNIHVEVQIEEQCDDETNGGDKNDGGLRQDAKNRLNRLGKLYAGGDDADISSPIHRTEAKFCADGSPTKQLSENARNKRGLSKLADLAQRVNQFEDDLTPVRKERDNSPAKTKKSWKPPAPKPPNTPPKSATKYRAPDPPVKETQEQKQVNWDKKVLDSLESQGFQRTESSSKLVYKYKTQQNKENVHENNEQAIRKPPSPQKSNIRATAIADKAALFESSPSRQSKDPALLSVSERKALFEKNKGAALVPKAPFAMATPIKKDPPKEKKVTAPASPKKEVATPRGEGIANKVAALFEQKSTISSEQIESNVREQRQKEMDLLLNRFHKNNDEVVNEEEEFDDDTEETAMIDEKSKNKVAVVSPREKRRSSGNKRCLTGKGDSPKVAAVLSEVKRIKVTPQRTGRLYPSLTDIESVTETENESPSPTTNGHSSDNSFAESDDANTSFGRDILRAVCQNQTPQKRQMMDESASDLSDVLDDMDDYIDEALAYNGQNDGPTPPKQERKSPIESSHSFNYKSFQPEFKTPTKVTPDQLPTHVVDGENILPLTHTVSFYRKQQTQVSTPPVRQIIRAMSIEESPEKPEEEDQIRVKIRELRNEVSKQEMIISQTSQALNLCNSTPEFMGSTEQVEAERVLLVATHRRQAAILESQRLEVEKTLKPQTDRSNQFPLEKGTLTLSKIVLPLKHKYVTALSAAGGKGHHVVCLVKYSDQVLPTQLVSTIASNRKNPELELQIPGTITFKNVYSDFAVAFEVYCLQAQEEILPHEVKYHIKKPNTKLTPKKTKESRLMRPIKESPAGPQVVRSPTFALMGYVVFSLQTINKKHWSLINTPSMSPLEGTIEMSLSYELSVTIEHRGFLTMFEDISGFGAWHRRWCLLKGDTLSYWKYPDDEKKTPPINSISLRDAITKQVGPVSREICARLHTFLIETEREGLPHDKDSLVTIRKGSKTIIRHLLSADTKEERIEWCNKFNSALAAIHFTKRE